MVNEIKTPDPFTTSRPLSSKVYQFQRFTKGKAVETDDVYYATEKGQIVDISFHQMGTFRTTTLYGLLTHGQCKV